MAKICGSETRIRDSDADIFLWILRHFKNTYFVGCSGFNKHIIHGMQYILTLYYDFTQFSQQQQQQKKTRKDVFI